MSSIIILFFSLYFFFQAEDGIRDRTVTGVQTCALPIFECAGYLVTAAHVPGHGGEFAGARIRPRFRLPETPNLFFNISVSFEVGFNQPEFEANTRTLEIRPILEHEQGRLYLSINPDLSKALKGPDQHEAPEFEPGVKVAW